MQGMKYHSNISYLEYHMKYYSNISYLQETGALKEPIRKKLDYLGVFPNRGWGGLLNPKTFVI